MAEKRAGEEKRERQREREFGLLLSLGEIQLIELPAKPRPWSFKQSRSPKRKNELLLSVFLHTPHLRSSPASRRQREPPLCAQHLLDCPPPDPATYEQEDHGGCEIPLKGHE